MFGGYSLLLAAAIMTLAGFTSAAAEPLELTERAAVELALSRPAFQEAEQARLATAQSDLTQAALYPNPLLALGRERVGGTESSIQLAQSFDISGRRTLRREAAEIRVEAAQRGKQDRRVATVADVRRAFGEALYRDRVRGVLAEWLKRIESATKIVSQLKKAGEASGYDLRRLEREAQSARARLAAADADYARAREVLTGFLGQIDAYQLIGEIIADAPPSLDVLQDALRERPDLASLGAQADAFDRERRAAERQWIPDMTLGVGHKRTEELGRSDNGVILALSAPLPLFDRGQAAEQRARAQAMTLRAERELLLTKAEAELRGAWRQAAELRDAAIEFRSQALSQSRELSGIAEAAYRGGEGGVLELLDAYRAELDADTTGLDLALRARLARIELDTLAGASYE